MRSIGLGSGMASDRTRCYRDAKFGMFIHGGPYSLASVEASWPIMTLTLAGISEAEYRELPRRFNPSQFGDWLAVNGESIYGTTHGPVQNKTRETLPAHLRLAVVAIGDIWAGHEGDVGALACRGAIIEKSTDRTPAPDRPATATARSERDRHCCQNSLSGRSRSCANARRSKGPPPYANRIMANIQTGSSS